jgi:hypothetical protein
VRVWCTGCGWGATCCGAVLRAGGGATEEFLKVLEHAHAAKRCGGGLAGLAGQSSTLLVAVVQRCNCAVARCWHEALDRRQRRADIPARLPELWMVLGNTEADFLADLKSTRRAQKHELGWLVRIIRGKDDSAMVHPARKRGVFRPAEHEVPVEQVVLRRVSFKVGRRLRTLPCACVCVYACKASPHSHQPRRRWKNRRAVLSTSGEADQQNKQVHHHPVGREANGRA